MKRKLKNLCLFLALFCSVSSTQFAFAQEHSQQQHHETTTESSSEKDTEHGMTAKQWAFKITNFSIFLLLMYFTAGKQFKKFLKTRRQTIETEIATAEQSQNTARVLLIEAEEKMAHFTDVKTKLVEKFRKEALIEQEHFQLLLQEQMSKMEHDFELQIQLAMKKSHLALMTHIKNESIRQATELLKKHIQPADQKNLLTNAIRELENDPPAAFYSKNTTNLSQRGGTP